MKRICTLVVMFAALAVAAYAGARLSASTQLFIAERNGEINLDMPTGGPTMMLRARAYGAPMRMVARSEEVNGVAMVPAFIHINPSQADVLSAQGVVVQESFKDFVTALIPVDRIEAVAELAGVREINVATVVECATDMSRVYSNVDDVLTHSADAVSAGLPTPFTGKGVVVGIIDSGIDFNHVMFQDTMGASRIKMLYIAKSSSSLTDYTSSIADLTADKTSSSHGTHTSSTAAGSNLTVNGVTYGGMAPEADIAMVALSNYSYTTNIANAIKYIYDFADKQGEPCVISMSLGSNMGPHDGTGELPSVFEQYAGNNPNHILCVSSGNFAGKGEWGVMHNEGTAAPGAPFSTVICGYASAQSNTYYNNYYAYYTWFYARQANVPLSCRLHIVDMEADTMVWSSAKITGSVNSVSGISTYFSASPKVTFAQDTYSGKWYIQLYYGSYISMKEPYTRSRYALAMTVYSDSVEITVDAWDYMYNTFPAYGATAGGYKFTAAEEGSTISDWSASDAVLSVGAYAAKNVVTDYLGETHTMNKFTLGDICNFSSYQKKGCGPTGAMKPDICAPGANVIAAINHYESSGYMKNAYTSSGYYLTNKDDARSMGSMGGTSMAAPCAAGVIALWLEAAKSVGDSLTTSDIRDIMAHTAIVDSYTLQPNFGPYGKIDALAGVKYILGDTTLTPVVLLEPDTLKVEALVGDTATASFVINGAHLNDGITLTLNDTAGVYSIDTAFVSVEDAAEGVTITLTYVPLQPGHDDATITVSTPGAADTLVIIEGFSPLATVAPVMLPADSAAIKLRSFRADWTDETEAEKVASYTLLVSLQPEVILLDSIDFSQTEAMSKNQADSASKYLPEGWVAGTGFYLDGGCVSLRGTMTSGTYVGYDKISVVLTAKSYYSATAATLTIGTGSATETLTLTSDFGEYVVVLEAGDSCQLRFTASNYPQVQSIAVYGGNITAPEGEDNIPKTEETYRELGVRSEELGVDSVMSFLVAGLRAGGTFNYKVKALYVDGTESVWSNVEQVTLFGEDAVETGDVNADGEVNIADVNALISIILGNSTEDDYAGVCDVNGDGEINIADVNAVIAIILGE